MIKFLETPEEITQLIGVRDDMEEHMSCSKGEAIQWLVEQTRLGNRNRYYILAHYSNNVIDSYVIFLNSINPPLFKNVSVLYLWSPLSCDAFPHEWDNVTEELFQEIIKKAEELGAEKVQTSIEWGSKCLKPLVKRGWKKSSFSMLYDIIEKDVNNE